MNICLVSGEYPPENGWGGIGTYTYYMGKGLHQAGHRVWVIARTVANAPARVERDGVTVLRVGPSRLHYYLARAKIARGNVSRLLQRLETQLAVARTVRDLENTVGLDVAEYPDSYADGLFHPWLCRSPYVVKLHIPYFVLQRYYPHETAGFIDSMERHFVSRAAAITAPSRSMADEVARAYRLPGERISILPNPLDTDLFSPPQQPSDVEAAEPLVLYVGWLQARKGVDGLAEAIPTVLRACPRARFLFVGADSEARLGKGSVRERLRQQLATHGCADRVDFREFEPDRLALARRYQGATLCVFPSRWDNLPYTVIEAMASGRPVVASAVGGIPDIVADGQTGLLVPPGDVAALAEAIVALLRDPLRRQRMSGQARQRAVQTYGLSSVSDETLAVYRAAAATRHR